MGNRKQKTGTKDPGSSWSTWSSRKATRGTDMTETPNPVSNSKEHPRRRRDSVASRDSEAYDVAMLTAEPPRLRRSSRSSEKSDVTSSVSMSDRSTPPKSATLDVPNDAAAGDFSDYDSRDRTRKMSQRLYLATSSLDPRIDKAEDPRMAYISQNAAGRVCIRQVIIPPWDLRPDNDEYGYRAPEDFGGERDVMLFRRLMFRTGLSGRKKKMETEWGIPERDRDDQTNLSGTHRNSVDDIPAFGVKDSLTIRVLKGDKNVLNGNPLRKAYEGVVRSVNKVMSSELGDDRSYRICGPILEQADTKDSKAVQGLISMTAQILIQARKAADRAGKTRSEQSCLSVGMVLLHHIAQDRLTQDSTALAKLDLALTSFNIEVGQSGQSYAPLWLNGVVKTFDEVIAADKTAEIFCRFYTLAYMMFIMWARFDRMSFIPEEVEVTAEGPWFYIKATTETGEAPDHPLGVPDDFVARSSKNRTTYSPWVLALFMGFFNTTPEKWTYVLLVLPILTILALDFFRCYCLGTSRRRTWSLPAWTCRFIERRGNLSLARERYGGGTTKLIMGHTNLGQYGSFAQCLKILLKNDEAGRVSAVTFRSAFMSNRLHIEDLRMNAKVMMKIRIAKDAYKSHLNHIQVCPDAERQSWHDSADFLYATKSIYELVVYDEWVLSIPFF